MIRFIYIFILSMMFFGCVDNKISENNIETKMLKYHYSFDNSIWKSDDVLEFNVDIIDTTSHYFNKISVCHTNDFMYQNLIILVYQIYNNDTIDIDTLDIQLARNDGKWLGYGENFKEVEYIYHSNIGHFRGKHRFEIELAMRSSDLVYLAEIEGITNIGLFVQNSNDIILNSDFLNSQKANNVYYIQKPKALIKLNELSSKRNHHICEDKFSISHSKSGKINYIKQEDEFSIFNIEYKDYNLDIYFKFRTVSDIALEILRFENPRILHFITTKNRSAAGKLNYFLAQKTAIS